MVDATHYALIERNRNWIMKGFKLKASSIENVHSNKIGARHLKGETIIS